ncbi:hypothetical protein JCM5353_006699 [Sporobolomyces roseus]
MLALQVGNQDEVVERCYDIQDLLKPCWDTFHNYTQQGISGRLSAASNQLRERPPSKLGDPNRWKTLLKLVPRAFDIYQLVRTCQPGEIWTTLIPRIVFDEALYASYGKSARQMRPREARKTITSSIIRDDWKRFQPQVQAAILDYLDGKRLAEKAAREALAGTRRRGLAHPERYWPKLPELQAIVQQRLRANHGRTIESGQSGLHSHSNRSSDVESSTQIHDFNLDPLNGRRPWIPIRRNIDEHTNPFVNPSIPAYLAQSSLTSSLSSQGINHPSLDSPMFHPPSSSSFPPQQNRRFSDIAFFPPLPQHIVLPANPFDPRFVLNNRPLRLPLDQITPHADGFVRQDQSHSTIPGDFLDFPPLYNPYLHSHHPY